METLWTGIKALKLWQYLVMVAVLMGAAGATYGVYAGITGSGGQELEENQRLIPVQIGNLVNQVTTNGSLVFPNRETLTFGSAGAVAEVLVEESQQVVIGQVLARLDQTTVASLDMAVAQARVNLQDFVDALDLVKNPPVLELATAQSRVADAELQLQQALETLADAREPYPLEEIKQQESVVANARLTLRDAEQSLADFAPEYSRQLAQARQTKAANEIAGIEARNVLAALGPDHAQQLARARQTKADAEVTLAGARDELAGFAPDYDRQLAQALQVKADTEVALEGAQDALADFGAAYVLELADARQAEPDAEIDLFHARGTLDRYEQANPGLDNARLAKIETQAALDNEQATLDSLLASRESGQGGIDARIEQVQASVELRLAELVAAQGPVAEVERLEEELALAQTNLDTSREDLARLETGPDPLRFQQLQAAVAVAQAGVEQAQTDLAGLGQASADVAELGPGPDPLDRRKLEAALEVAESNLASADDALDNMSSQGSAQDIALQEVKVAGAQAELIRAEERLAASSATAVAPEGKSPENQIAALRDNLWLAEQSLAAIIAGADPLELASREAHLASAVAELAEAQQNLSLLEAALDPLELASREAAAALTEEALAQAERNLAEMLLGADPTEVASKEEQLAVAQATLAEAKETLVELLRGPDLLQVGLKEAEVTTAQLALEEAISRSENATLRSPMAGFVALVNVEAGSEVGPNMAIIEVVDPTVMEVDGIVDEIDVRLVQLGAQAAVSMDAFPGQTLEGIVTAIAPAARNQQGVVTYPIRIRMNVPEGMQLREGLSATANIILRRESDVLLVPQQALYGSFDAPVIRVMTSSGIEERPVVLGNSDGFWTVVRQGLAEGEQVVMEVSPTTSDPFAAFRQFRGGFGGGGGGFGGGRPIGGGR